MRLKKKQKEALLKWVAVGLESGEINKRAGVFKPPFSVSRGQVVYYRKTRQTEFKEIIKNGEHEALNSGLALRAERVKKLKKLAGMLEDDLFNTGLLWTEEVKGVGAGAAAIVVEFEVFNKAEVDAYRGILDDIAKEVGHRTQKLEHTGAKGSEIVFRVVRE